MGNLYGELLGLAPGRLQRPVLNFRGGGRTPGHPAGQTPTIHSNSISTCFALEGGATLLLEADDHTTYGDPAGHPFCMYPDSSLERGAVIGRVVIDCFSPRALAGFYADFLEMQRVQDSRGRVVIAYPDGRLPMLGFQHVARYISPRWQDPDYPSQIHLDMHFEDVDEARTRAEQLGAIRLPDGGSCPVYGSAGHPFCLCSSGQ